MFVSPDYLLERESAPDVGSSCGNHRDGWQQGATTMSDECWG